MEIIFNKMTVKKNLEERGWSPYSKKSVLIIVEDFRKPERAYRTSTENGKIPDKNSF